VKRKVTISLLFFLISSCAWCVCQVPRPRLVCAEYSQSEAVVIAKLISVTSDSKKYPSYFIYRLIVVKRLRGQAPQTFDLYEGNDSGRATFDWNQNGKYLLFLEQGSSVSHGDWIVDGCGNSAPLANASTTLQQIQHMSSVSMRGTISGMVGTDSWTTGLPGVTIRVSGNHRTFETETNANGRFSQVVPVGTYTITAKKNGESVAAEPFSYENPAHAVIAPGGCAQVQFTDSQH
jgi:hypothetical protein